MEATTEKRRAKSKSSAATHNEVPCELPRYLWERVRARAYELWKQRGCREGYALQDWLEAERIVMETLK
jgi:hypothetical protein